VSSPEPDRYQPVPSLLELPGHLLRGLSLRGRRLALAGIVVIAAGLLAVFVWVAPAARDRAAADDRAEARQAAARKEARRVQIAREARPLRGRGPAAAGLDGAPAVRRRAALLSGVEAAVLADARRRAERGELRGPYRSAACFGFPATVGTRPLAEDVARRTAVLECIAVSTRIRRNPRTSGAFLGQPFRARVDFARGRYAWCKIVQRPGELSFDPDPLLRVSPVCGGR
jgi:hypothetical protein